MFLASIRLARPRRLSGQEGCLSGLRLPRQGLKWNRPSGWRAGSAPVRERTWMCVERTPLRPCGLARFFRASAASGVCFFGYFLCTSKESDPRAGRARKNKMMQGRNRPALPQPPLLRVCPKERSRHVRSCRQDRATASTWRRLLSTSPDTLPPDVWRCRSRRAPCAAARSRRGRCRCRGSRKA